MKFRYGDKVRVIGGFHQGRVGNVIDTHNSIEYCFWGYKERLKYMVAFGSGISIRHEFIKPEYLELVTEIRLDKKSKKQTIITIEDAEPRDIRYFIETMKKSTKTKGKYIITNKRVHVIEV